MANSEVIALKTLGAVREIEDFYISQLETTMRTLERRLTDMLKASETTKAVDIALAKSQIQGILLDSGYYQVTGELLNEGFQDIMELAHRQYQDIFDTSFQLADESLQRINALKELDFGKFNSLAVDSIEDLNRLMIDVGFGNTSFKDAVEMMRMQVVDRLQRHASTWVTTATSGVYREANTSLAEDNGITKFIYRGPLDAITRPFCRKYLGQIKTMDEWNALQSEQGQVAPVSQFGGGYNCRHTFVGVE